MDRLLDFGSGRGYFAHYLASNKNNDVYGIDISEDNIEFAKKHFNDAKFFVSESLPLPFDSGFFNQIYMMDVLEHVDDLSATLDEVTRLLKKNGKLVVNVPADKSEEWLLKIRPTYHKEIHHVRIFRNNEMEQLLSKYGFKLSMKKAEGFIENFALYYLFKTTPISNTQLAIGDWNQSLLSKLIFFIFLLFSQKILTTRLRYLPIWLVTLPIGLAVDYIGSRFFPKSKYYEFSKI